MIEILSIIIFNIAIYWKTFLNNIVLDDIPQAQYILKGPGTLKTPQDYIKFICARLYGCCTFGPNLVIDHAFRLSLWILAGILIYVAFGMDKISFCAALLYSCHPINNQLAIWLNGRRFIINIILVLLMIIFSPIGILFYLLTPGFQVSAIFAPILLSEKYPLALLAIPLVLLLGYRTIKIKVLGRAKAVKDDDRNKFTPKRLIIITKYYGHYFWKMLFPGVCAIIYPSTYYWGLTEKGNKDAYSFNAEFSRGIIAFFISFGILYVIPISYKFFVAFMIFSTLQWCAIIPYIQDKADRYASLPNVFMMFFLSYFIHTYMGIYAITAITGFIVYYVVMNFIVQRMYPNMAAFWDYQNYLFPTIPSPRKYQINWLIERKEIMKAWVLCQEGLRLNPNEYIYLFQAAVCHKAIGQIPLAEYFAKEAMKNFYIGQEETQRPILQRFLDSLTNPTFAPPTRQQRRAEERKKSG